MGQKPHARDRPAELKYALRWLRHRLRLTQTEVAEGVRHQGGAVSVRHYQELEAGTKHPSPDLRTLILRVLGSDDDELHGLLQTRPWAERPLGRYYPSRVLPRPDVYVAAGRRALEALPADAPWSSPVLRDVTAASADQAALETNATRAILAELEVLLPLLSSDAQRQVLRHTRRLAGGAERERP
jgi:transcriptional regulator with XRE-family HTH domain